MQRGGLTYPEQRGLEALDRLEAASEVHRALQLPCCGSLVEILDWTRDNYVQCPNPKCLKRHVVLGNISGGTSQIRSEITDEPAHHPGLVR